MEKKPYNSLSINFVYMQLPDLRHIARIAMVRCTRGAKFEVVYNATIPKHIKLIFCYVI